MKHLCLALLLLTLGSCSKDNPEPDTPDNPQSENPEDPDSQDPGSEPEPPYPYEVTVLSFGQNQVSEIGLDAFGEITTNTDITAELELGTNQSPGVLFVDDAQYTFVRTSQPTHLASRNAATQEQRVIRPFCDDLLNYTGADIRSTARHTGVFFRENSAARVDVYSMDTNSCHSYTFPEITNATYKGYIAGDVLIVDNGRSGNTGGFNPDYQMRFVDLNTQSEYQVLDLPETFRSLVVHADQVYLFYYLGGSDTTYEIRSLQTLEVLQEQQPTQLFPPEVPFFNASIEGDMFSYEVSGAAPGIFAKLPALYSISSDEVLFADFYSLYQKFQDDYFQANGELPYGLNFEDYALDPITGDLVIGFLYTKNSQGNTDFEGGILFTNIYDIEAYTAYYIDAVPNRVIVGF